ncbi:hypothetical protein [Salinibacter grassmerensis]|uniref:hypothetical protein n=1 Tax=Salinibacter grassmerensis TaxID=3040353 RepID=UPI0021E82E11|nr:hypothetical protein [Salinibacter grassmerensis]
MHTVQRLVGLLVAVVLVGATGAWAQLPSNELEGTWRMVSQELVYPDSVVDQSDSWGANVKIINSTHFAWGREMEDGESVLAGGGRYEYYPERDVYIEHIQYHSDPSMNGVTLRFEARIEDDTWYHIGEVGDYKLREVWKRVDPEQVQAELQNGTMTGERQADSSENP